MKISNIKNIVWEKDVEEFEKWYNAQLEIETLITSRNPLTKLFTKHSSNVLILNTQYYYDRTGFKWDEDRDRTLQKRPLTLLTKLILKTKQYIKTIKRIAKDLEETKKVDGASLQKFRELFFLIWCIFMADLGKPLASLIQKRLEKRGLNPRQIDTIINYCISFRNAFEFQKEAEGLKKIYRHLPQQYKANSVVFKTLPQSIQNTILTHWKKYRHLTGAWLDTRPETPPELFRRLLMMGKTQSPKRIQKIPKRLQQFLSKDDLQLISLTRQHSFFDNYVSDIYERLDFLLNQHLSKQFSITSKDLSWYSFDELEALTKYGKKLTNQQREQRKQYRIMVQVDGKVTMFYGKRNFEEVQKAISGKLPLLTATTTLKGFTASRGFIRAPVKIVNQTKDMNKVKTGDILVATMTHPDLMLAIQKCSGIITDAGGITSHAAIISREFRIPCIVGTRIATKVLKDGDLVELDANNGTVLIIS
ncbi:MAG: hypothetical protein HYZ02_02905 [Candidatus Levybacteria bacterium]|nr:hypothetical protein [Candidatus Levybacteria bacterium]